MCWEKRLQWDDAWLEEQEAPSQERETEAPVAREDAEPDPDRERELVEV